MEYLCDYHHRDIHLFLLLVPWALRDFLPSTLCHYSGSPSIYINNGKMLKDIHDIADGIRSSNNTRPSAYPLFAGWTGFSRLHLLLIFNNYNFILEEARVQQAAAQQYVRTIDGEKMYYIIRQGELAGFPVYLFSYTWEAYQNDLVENLFSQLLWLIAIILLVSWIPSFLMARYITKPIIKMENHVRDIANRNWYESIDVDRDDEIGKLGQSIERMRKQLVEQEDMQRSFLQHISHELKTPVMVIRSYARPLPTGYSQRRPGRIH